MFRSLFARLLTVYLVVVLALLATLTVLFGVIYQTNYYADRTSALISEAQELADMNAAYMPASGGVLAQACYHTALRYDAVVWLVDKTGGITAVRVDGGPQTDTSMTTDEFEQYFSRVMRGETVTERGVFGGRFFDEMLTVGVPVKRGGNVSGAVFLHAHVQTVQMELLAIYRRFGAAALVLVLVGAAVVFWVSSLVTRPLTQINRAAQELARGNFGKRVPINSRRHDEVGQLARTFNTMADELQKQEEMRRGFVANVSHELRSPMTSVQGFAQGMLDGTIAQEEHPRYLGIIVAETRRLNKLIRELLDLAQIESGKEPLNRKNFDVNESLRRALIRFEGRIDEKNVEVDVDFRTEKAMVWADPDRIEQVLTNLLDNAVKFLPQQGGRLSVWSHTAEDKIIIGIRDNGPGIPEQEQPYIWERFYKVDKAHSGKKGTGLGLPIVKRILEQHGERITLQSRSGAGCAFVFTLPPAKQAAITDK